MEERIGSEARSSDLEMDLLSSGDTVGAETFALVPSSSQPSVSQPPRSFHALKEECSLSEETLSSFKDRFQFLRRLRSVFLVQAKNLVPLPMTRYVSIRLPFCAASGFLSIPS